MSIYHLLQRTRPQLFDALGHFARRFSKRCPLPARNKIYFQSLALNANALQQFSRASDTRLRPFIAAHMMTVAQRTRHHIDSIRALLKRFQDVAHIGLAGARQTHQFDVGRILQTQRARRVRRHVSAVDTGEGCYFGFEVAVRVHRLYICNNRRGGSSSLIRKVTWFTLFTLFQSECRHGRTNPQFRKKENGRIRNPNPHNDLRNHFPHFHPFPYFHCFPFT